MLESYQDLFSQDPGRIFYQDILKWDFGYKFFMYSFSERLFSNGQTLFNPFGFTFLVINPKSKLGSKNVATFMFSELV